MSYLELLKRFWLANRQMRFSTAERELYFFLLNEANSNFWQMPVSCPTAVVCSLIGMSRATVIRAREGLQNRGLISFTLGQQNSRAPTYIILDGAADETACETAYKTACITARVTAHETARATIIKDKDKHSVYKNNGNYSNISYSQRRGFDAPHASAEEF